MRTRQDTRAGFLRLFLAVLVVGAVTAVGHAEVAFVDVTAEAFPDGLSNGHYLWGDCDGDGDEDLLVGAKTIYINQGPPGFVFSRLTDTGDLAAGVHQRATWIDIDNDGDLDIFGIGNEDRERLFRNDGACTFTDISDFDGNGSPDMVDGSPSTTTTSGDYDGDGFLDLYVGNYERYCTSDPPICGDCMTDRLWRNLGDNTFEDVTVSSQIYDQEHAITGICLVAGTPCVSDADCDPYPADSCKSGTCARGSNWVDYDNDGDQDIFVSNYRLDPNLMWENNGDGTFTEVAELRNLDGDEDSGSWGHVLGSDWADYDNDGDMDVYTANLAHGIYVVLLGHDISQMLKSSGSPGFNFLDVRVSSGMRPYDPYTQPDWAETCPAWADYDNDGNLDIYVTHIYTSSTLNFSTMYHSNGDGSFTETTTSHGPDLGLYKNYSAAWCDYDQDGDLDLITYGAPTPTGTSEAHLYRNDGGNQNEWLEVTVRGRGSGGGTNFFGVGVRVTATVGTTTQMREVQGGHGYHTAMNSMPVEFGFGSLVEPPVVDELTIRWTDGQIDVYQNVPMRTRLFTAEETPLRRGADPSVDPLPVLDPAAKLFPYSDPVLSDGNSYYYRVDYPPKAFLHVEKDPANDAVEITVH